MMKNKIKKNTFPLILSLLLVSSLLFFSCKTESPSGPEPYTYQVPEQTGDGWETASLGDVGMDENLLTELVNNINSNVYTEVHSVVIIKEGRLVFEVYFPGHVFNYSGENYHGGIANYNRDTPHNTHSATKSVTSALTCIAIDKGFIRDVDEKIFTFFDDYSDLNTGGKDDITVEHLLTMTSGLEWNEWDISISDGNHDLVQFNRSSDPVAYILSKPLVTEPGTAFYYNGGAVDLLGEIVRIASGIRLDDFSEQYLFGPLGITNYNWQTLRSGIVCAHGDIHIRPRDMAKFGYLFLENGVWNGSAIISEAWVQKSIEEYISLPQLGWADGYGYLWWLYTYHSNNGAFESFRADGWGGQQIVVFPGIDMVVVFTGANYVSNPPCEDILNRYILPAVDAF
jgi:CubicO group peptidase (beta-lactamase class C family)